MFEKFLSALPAIAGSSYAFVAYIILIIAFVFISYSQFRLKTIARIIETVPANERATLLTREYNVTPQAGLSAEQWLENRRQTMSFLLKAAIIAAIVVVVVIVLQTYFTTAAAAAERAQLINLWRIEHEQLTGLVKANFISESSYFTIIASMNALTAKLDNPDEAIKQYNQIVNKVQEILEEQKQKGGSDSVNQANKALSEGAPELAMALLEKNAREKTAEAAKSLLLVGKLQEQQAKYYDSIDTFNRALSIEPNNIELLGALQEVQFMIGRFEESIATLKKIESYGQGTQTSRDAEEIKLSYANIYLAQSKFAEADVIFSDVRKRMEHDGDISGGEYAKLLNNIGSMYHNWGKYQEAKVNLSKSRELYEELGETFEQELARVLSNCAYLDTLLHKFEHVERYLDDALRIASKKDDQRQVIAILNNYARFRAYRGDYVDALKKIEAAHSIGNTVFGGVHPFVARTFDIEAETKLLMGDLKGAQDAAEKAIEINKKIFGNESMQVALSRTIKGQGFIIGDNNQEALDELGSASNTLAPILGPNSARSGYIMSYLGRVMLKLARPEQGWECLRAGLRVLSVQLGSDHSDVLTLRRLMGANEDGAAICPPFGEI